MDIFLNEEIRRMIEISAGVDRTGDNFKDAVILAYKYFKGRENILKSDFRAVDAAHGLDLLRDALKGVKLDFSGDNFQKFLAKNPKFGKMFLKPIVSGLLRKGDLPPELSVFAADLIDGKRIEPKGTLPKARRDLLIYVAVNTLVGALNLYPYRNVATKSNHCACDAVAEALAKAGVSLDARNVQKIYSNFSQTLEK